MAKMIQIKLLTGEKMVVTFDKHGNARLESDLKAADGSNPEFDCAIDGLESLVLSHISAGLDVTDPKYVKGIETALDAIANEYD